MIGDEGKCKNRIFALASLHTFFFIRIGNSTFSLRPNRHDMPCLANIIHGLNNVVICWTSADKFRNERNVRNYILS